MNITIVADVLGEENNGTSTACMNLVRYLKSQGDNVNIICCDKDKKNEEGYYVVGTKNFGPLINKIIAKNNVTLAKPNKKVLYEAIKDSDVVHIMMPFALGNAAVKMANKLNKPVTAGFHVQAENFTSHIGMMNSHFINHITYKWFYHTLYSKVDAIHYPSNFIRNIFESETNHKTNGYVISNGVNNAFRYKLIEKPEELKDKFVILFTGRFSKEKSHNILIKAVALSKHKDDIQLIFAGQGPLKGKALSLAKKLNINKPIINFYKRDELVNIINYADLYCHPAEVEIEAIACIEAISCGVVPVIANSKKCATKEFALDERNLFECNNPKSLAEKIDYWFEHEEERKECSKAYLANNNRFNQDYCMHKMKDMMIESLVKANA